MKVLFWKLISNRELKTYFFCGQSLYFCRLLIKSNIFLHNFNKKKKVNEWDEHGYSGRSSTFGPKIQAYFWKLIAKELLKIIEEVFFFYCYMLLFFNVFLKINNNWTVDLGTSLTSSLQKCHRQLFGKTSAIWVVWNQKNWNMSSICVALAMFSRKGFFLFWNMLKLRNCL